MIGYVLLFFVIFPGVGGIFLVALGCYSVAIYAVQKYRERKLETIFLNMWGDMLNLPRNGSWNAKYRQRLDAYVNSPYKQNVIPAGCEYGGIDE